MQRKDERGGSISGPSGAEAQAAATHQAPPTQTQPIDTTKMRIKQVYCSRKLTYKSRFDIIKIALVQSAEYQL